MRAAAVVVYTLYIYNIIYIVCPVRVCGVCVSVCVCVHIIYNTFFYIYDEGPGINLHACVYTEYVLCVWVCARAATTDTIT